MLYRSTPFSARQFLMWSVFSLGLVIAWDAGGLDLALARWFGTAQGFPLQHNWWLEKVLHSKAQRLAWLVTLGLALMIRWPLGPFRTLPRADRVWLVVGILLAVLSIQLLKRGSQTSCPWSLAEFGGKAAYVSHWLWGVRDGGRGHCFPAGHASTAFCYLAGYFWLRPWAPRAARIWLVLTLVLGFALGGVQMVRGAHYLSHVLWSGWFCWVVGGALWFAVQAWRARQHGLGVLHVASTERRLSFSMPGQPGMGYSVADRQNGSVTLRAGTEREPRGAGSAFPG